MSTPDDMQAWLSGIALVTALDTFDDEALRELERGDEEPIETLRWYARSILQQRRLAENAPNN